METQTDEHVWGAPQPEPAHWSMNKTVAAVGIAVVLAGAGAAVIYAAAGSTDHAGSGFGGPPGGPGGFGGPGGPPGGPGGFGPADAPAALHGEFVVPDGRGGYATELTQTGIVTDISDTSVTARSEDGFTQTYVITTDTRQGRTRVEAGDTATIRAVTADGTKTATVISDAD
ncbi:hypothetical protein [Mycolicibacterium mengxianglii]|uniref:hypothetical protein n=1 Tax=Mycolicibacterium mengxianglii TaxID=2736649 RepID=UPI0018EEDA19|nr:hypothetical protein [Mycolicibacterium mengxianglii]